MKIILSPAKKMKYDDGLGTECITTAEHRIEDSEKIKEFRELGYRYHEELSSDKEFVFLKGKGQGDDR